MNSRSPTVTVIIPVHNGAQFLRAGLSALLVASSRNYEVIVVDDASTDASPEIAREFATRVITLPRRGGPATARNVGAAAARGKYFVFLDADVRVHPDTIDRLINVLVDDANVSAVFGSYDDRPACPGLVSQFRNLLHHDIHQTAHVNAVTFWAGCGAIRREWFLRLSGFDESYRRPDIEDIELGHRLCSSGGRIVLAKDAQVTHLKSWNLWSMVKCDFASRGIPWTRLILQQRTLPNDLNLRYVHRASVVGVYLALLAFVVASGWQSRDAAIIGLSVLVTTGLINLPFYSRLRLRRGLEFALLAVPLHIVHYLVCGAAFLAGCALFAWDGLTRKERRSEAPVLSTSAHAPGQNGRPAPVAAELEEQRI